jgi:hypothetical protein
MGRRMLGVANTGWYQESSLPAGPVLSLSLPLGLATSQESLLCPVKSPSKIIHPLPAVPRHALVLRAYSQAKATSGDVLV